MMKFFVLKRLTVSLEGWARLLLDLDKLMQIRSDPYFFAGFASIPYGIRSDLIEISANSDF
jgi:hypothetical protein